MDASSTAYSTSSSGSAPLSLAFDEPTPEQISIYCPLTRAVAAGTRVHVRYKLESAGTWSVGHELLHIVPAQSPAPDFASYPGHAQIIPAFAGWIIDLTPGQAYSVELTVQEPGQPDVVLSGTGRTASLAPAAGAANKNATTASNLQDILNGLQPGDVLELAPGTYAVSNLQVTAGGTLQSPVFIRGASRDAVVLHDPNGTVLQLNGVSHVILEDLTIRGSQVAIGDTANSIGIAFWGGRPGPQQNVTIRRVTFEGVDQGVIAVKPTIGVQVHDCALTGTSQYEDAYRPNPDHTYQYPNWTWSHDGLRLAGYGNAAWHNTLDRFGDAFAVDALSDSRAVYFYRNHVAGTGDDGMECDYIYRGGLYDNWFANSATAISGDLIFGGPMLVARNVFLNVIRHIAKLTSQSHGLQVYNNTIVRSAADPAFPMPEHDTAGWYQGGAGTQAAMAWRNNLFVYRGDASRLLYWAAGVDRLAWTHNAWHPSTRTVSWGGQQFVGGISGAAAGLPAITTINGAGQRFSGDVPVESNPWQGTVTVGSFTTRCTHTPSDTNLALAAGCAARNAGVVVPNITDGYTGVAPDIGARIAGRPQPFTENNTHGVLGAAAAALPSGQWADVSASTNVRHITDAHPDGGAPFPWLNVRLFGGETPIRIGTDWSGKATWDAATRQIMLVGSSAGAIPAEQYEGQSTFALFLDVASGQLSRTWNPLGGTRTWHQYDANISRPLNGYIYRRGGDSGTVLKRMNVATREWETVTTSTIITGGVAVGMDVHPTLGSQGSVLVADTDGRLARWDVATSTPTTIAPSHPGVVGLSPVISYHPGIDAVVFGGGDSGVALYTVSNTGAVSLLTSQAPAGVTNIGPRSGAYGTVFLPDPLGRAIAHLIDYGPTRTHYTLDLVTGAWSLVGPVPASFGAEFAACGASVPELGAIVWLDGNTSGTPLNNSRIWIQKM